MASRIFDRLMNWSFGCGAFMLGAMGLFLAYDVVMRYAFARPNIWAMQMSEYTLVYEGSHQETLTDGVSTWAAISAYRGRKHLAALRPRLDRYQDFEDPVPVPALFSGLREDLYVVPLGWAEDGSLLIDVRVSPLINLLWLGAFVLLVGGLVALWPVAGVEVTWGSVPCW